MRDFYGAFGARRVGDVVVISELVVHGALSWQPKDRQRRFLTLRYCSQHIPLPTPCPRT